MCKNIFCHCKCNEMERSRQSVILINLQNWDAPILNTYKKGLAHHQTFI